MRVTVGFFFSLLHTSDHTGSIVQRLVAEGMNCLTLSYTAPLIL